MPASLMPALRTRHLLCSLLLAACIPPVQAQPCPQGQQQVCVVACFCAPASAGGGQDYERFSRMTAFALQNWLQYSRDSALAAGVQPMPLQIRAQLEPWFDFGVLDAARYRVGDPSTLAAADAMLQNPDVNAVTLVDVIVFRHAADAEDNAALWAHELKHVEQYQQWGVAEFAWRYTQDYRAVEAPAYALEREVSQALKAAEAAP
ncbi:eCIS core domain-containing protein [Stutzerimonas balearica]|uniref:eCIS core domain-containing protein n=2 Tax=Stutzerimonas balearica TaxID=74829 RepID=UPI0035E3F709